MGVCSTARLSNCRYLAGRSPKVSRSVIVPKSVLEAIKIGLWDFEPPEVDPTQFDSTDAMPGTEAKLQVLAERVAAGLPLWHPNDRRDLSEHRVTGRVKENRRQARKHSKTRR